VRRLRFILGVLVLVAIGAGAYLAWARGRAEQQEGYVTQPVSRGPVTATVTATGTVNPVTTVQVGTYVSGIIQDLYCDFNTTVRKGQLCARIDPRPYQMTVDQNRANLATARAQLARDRTALDYAKTTYERTAALHAQGIVSQDALDGAKAAFDQAGAEVDVDNAAIEQRQAALTAAQINLAYTNIVSPVDGTVVARNVTTGQTVAASFQTPTLFLIAADLTKMQVDANVSESDIGGIAAGQAATFTVEAFPARTFEGEVTAVRQAPQTVQNVVTYDVVISVANPDLLLKPGMTATVRVILDRRDGVLRVPGPALRYVPGGLAGAAGARGAPPPATQVWVLRDGRPTAVPVVTGLDDDAFAEVVRGDLKVGDRVITGEQADGGSSSSRLPFLRL
jgi:HlyD family secretion protein